MTRFTPMVTTVATTAYAGLNFNLLVLIAPLPKYAPEMISLVLFEAVLLCFGILDPRRYLRVLITGVLL